VARLVLRNAAGIVATHDIVLAAAPVGGGDPHPNPPFSTGAFTIASNTDVDLGWNQYASFWCDHRNDWVRRRFIIDGRAIVPNPNQVEPKIFGAQRFKLSNFVVRYVASASTSENGGGDIEHTEGLYLGAARDGVIEYGYFAFNEGTTCNSIFFTWWPDSGAVARNIDVVKCRFDLSGLTGNNRTRWGSQIWNTFDYNGLPVNLRFIDCQIRQGAPGSNRFGGGSAQLGQWSYGGSAQGGSGSGFLSVPQGAPWPAFPDGSQGPPVLYA
jgi:hypothetical protein